MEGDKRLDKLESFLDKLHSKGTILFCVCFVLLSVYKKKKSVYFHIHSPFTACSIFYLTVTSSLVSSLKAKYSKKASVRETNVPCNAPLLSRLCPDIMVAVSGVSKSKTSTIEVTAEMEKEVMTLDDEETFGNFYKSVSPTTLLDSSVVLTEEDLSQIQPDTPKLVHNYPKFSSQNCSVCKHFATMLFLSVLLKNK